MIAFLALRPLRLANLAAVDFGIIVDSAVILVENIFRNFQSDPQTRRRLLAHLAEHGLGEDHTRV